MSCIEMISINWKHVGHMKLYWLSDDYSLVVE
jgi:hypothetical protein